MQTKKLKFVFGTVVIVGAVLTLAITGMEESKAYYQTVPELKAMGVKAEGRRVRVAGDVVVGSIERHEEGVVTFVIDYEGEDSAGALRRPRTSSRHPFGPSPGGRRRNAQARRYLRGHARPGEVCF